MPTQNQWGVGLFGAFDRHNFGDWLLAWCAERLLNSTEVCPWLVDFPTVGRGVNQNCGPFMRTGEYLTSATEPRIIHVGGETLTCTTQDARHMSGQPVGPAMRPIFYVLSEEETGERTRRSFFGVGGQQLGELDDSAKSWLRDSLASATWLSVRDSVSEAQLKALGLSPEVHPDLVSMISRLYPVPKQPGRDRVLLVQVSDAYLSQSAEHLVRALSKISADFDCVEVAVAGIAPGHDSFRQALSLVGNLNKANPHKSRLLCELDPLRLVERIGNSSAVISTSLHFRIISMALGIPRVSMGPTKTLNYASDWDFAPFFAKSPGQIEEELAAASTIPMGEYLKRADYLASLTEVSWRAMMEGID